MKKYVIGIVIGFALAIGVVSALNASDIDYKDTKLDQALDDLYEKANMPISFGTPKYAVSAGDQNGARTVTLTNLTKGKYIVVKTISSAYASSTNPDEIDGELSLGGSGALVCSSSNCITRMVGGYETRKQASTAVTGNYKENNYIAYNVIYVEIKENTDTITYTINDSTNNKAVRSIGLGAIPIGE